MDGIHVPEALDSLLTLQPRLLVGANRHNLDGLDNMAFFSRLSRRVSWASRSNAWPRRS